ncbi:MAG: TlpA disulfide reductase family protein [Ahrensia sp.]
MNKQSPKNDQPTPASAKAPMSMGKLIGIALVAGAVVGTGGLYVMGGFDGNGAQVANKATDANSGGTCEASFEAAADLAPLMTGDIAAMAMRTQGEPIGDLSFLNADGEALTLADTGTKYRLINLWATWCAPCREEMPWLDELQATKGGDDFKVVAISVDGGSADKPKAFFNEVGVQNLTYYQDPTIDVFNRLKREGLAFGLPVTLLVDDANCVIANMNGPAHWNSPDAMALADALVGR